MRKKSSFIIEFYECNFNLCAGDQISDPGFTGFKYLIANRKTKIHPGFTDDYASACFEK